MSSNCSVLQNSLKIPRGRTCGRHASGRRGGLSNSCWWKPRRRAAQRINLIRMSFWCFDATLRHPNVKISAMNSVREAGAFKERFPSPVSRSLCHEQRNFLLPRNETKLSPELLKARLTTDRYDTLILYPPSWPPGISQHLVFCCCTRRDAFIFTSVLCHC